MKFIRSRKKHSHWVSRYSVEVSNCTINNQQSIEYKISQIKSKYQEQLVHNIYLKAAMIHATVGKVFNTNMSKSLLFIKEPSLIK